MTKPKLCFDISVKREVVKLSHIATPNARIGWQNLRRSEFKDDGDVYIITGTDFESGLVNFKGCKFVDLDRYEMDSKIKIHENDILVTKDGTIGKVAIVKGLDKKATLNAGVFVLNDIATSVDREYLYHYLRSPLLLKFIKSASTGGTILHLNQSVLLDFPVCLPELKEQKKIAALFTALDEKIKIQKDVLNILILQREQFLRDIFSKNIGFCENFGLKSADWVSVQLKDISEIKTGPFGSLLHAEDYVQKGIPIVTTEHFKKGSLPLVGDGIPQVSLSDSERLSSYKLETGDIVFSRVGSVDINALVEECHSGWLFSGRVLRVRCNEAVDARFLHYALSTNVVKKDIIARAVGLTMASINTSILAETKVEIPVSQKEQEFIGRFMNFLDKRISIKEQRLNELVRLKRSFMQQMFV